MKFVADPKHQDYFFPPAMQEIFSCFEKSLTSNNKAFLFSDAYHKAKGLPNGIALVSEEADTYLYPAILRDPGCGFSLFALNLNPNKNISHLNQCLLEWENFYENNGVTTSLLDNLRAYCFGEKDWRQIEHRQQCDGPRPVNVDDIYLDAQEIESLMADFTKITNTLEIKKIHKSTIKGIDSTSLIGVFHLGSDFLPVILEDKFYSLINQDVEIDYGRRGMGSISLNSTLGQYYYQWLLFAMNFCLAKRYFMVQSLSYYLQAKNIGTLTFLDDKIHAGIWKSPFHSNQWIQTRGVQNQSSSANFPYTYIAGHRETLSVLVSPGNNASNIHYLLCHGTGMQTEGLVNHAFSQLFTASDVSTFARKCYFNTKPEYDLSYAYTQNLLATLAYYQEQKYINDIVFLEPVINVQSQIYIKNAAYLRRKA